MVYVIYNRVSSIGQNEYNKGISLNVQEKICHKYASENKIQCRSIYKEIHSAYNKLPPVLNNIADKKNCNIIISSIDRYSRSLYLGLQLANKIINNGGSLTFVQENIICKNVEDIAQLRSHLQASEFESSLISKRVKKSKAYLKNNGMFAGGYVPYGYEVLNRKLIKHSYEQKVIKFIKCCRNAPISYADLNKCMRNISQLTTFVPINCYDENDKVIKSINRSLNFNEISVLLNDYYCTKRGNVWNSRTVNSAIFPKTSKISNQFSNWNDIKKELSDVENSEVQLPDDCDDCDDSDSSDCEIKPCHMAIHERYNQISDKEYNDYVNSLFSQNNSHSTNNTSRSYLDVPEFKSADKSDYPPLPDDSNSEESEFEILHNSNGKKLNNIDTTNKMSVVQPIRKIKKSRSRRNTETPYRMRNKSKRSKQPVSSMESDSDDNETDNRMMSEYELFQQFKEFQKFKNSMK